MKSTDLVMVVPSRGRPDALAPLVESFLGTSSGARLIVALDTDDPELGGYKTAWRAFEGHDRLKLRVGKRLRLAGTLNTVVKAQASKCSAIGFMGDDHRPRTSGWDDRFAECLSGGGPGVVYGNDLLVGEKFPTAVMMTSDIPRTLGYFCPPGLVHLCLDLAWKDWGTGLGRITYLADVVIEHLHPAGGKAEFDDRYAEVNSDERVREDSAAYYAYRDEGGLEADLDKLRTLL